MIPSIDAETGNLPPGIHIVSWQELAARYGGTQHRRKLLDELQRVLAALQRAGCQRAYVDGSFVTSDQLESIAPTLLDFEDRRKAQKATYGGEMFPARWSAEPSGTAFLEFFQRDKHTGEPKGIIAIELKDFP